jgi:long-chain fatty acid transport protein
MRRFFPRNSIHGVALLGTVACCSLVSSGAYAAGFATARFGGEHGNPMTDSPTAIYYNPAGIALSDGINIFADGNIALRSLSYYRSPVQSPPNGSEVPEPADAQGANTGQASLFNVVAAPMLGATIKKDVTDNVALAGGLGFFVPFGGSAVWDKNENFRDSKYPGAVDGTQRFYAIQGTIRTIYISGAFAVSIKDLVSLGISGGVELTSMDSLRSRDPKGDTSLTNEGRAWFKGKQTGPQLGGGILVTPLDDKDKLRIGFSYQAPPNFGKMKVRGLLQKYFGGALVGNEAGKDDVETHQTLPDIFRLGVSFRPRHDLELRLFGDYTRWSLLQDQPLCAADQPCEISHGADGNKDGEVAPSTSKDHALVNLPRRWRDSGGVRAGASLWVRQPVEIFVGLGYDSSAVPDHTLEPALVDFHSMSTAAGVRAQFVQQFAGAISYTQFFYFTRDISGKSQNWQYPFPSNSPDSGGVYKQSIGVININLQATFDPFTKHPEPNKTGPNNTGTATGSAAW